MPENKVYRFKLNPNKAQESTLNNFAGARRRIFNWALGRQIATYKATGKSIPWSTLSAELPTLKNIPGLEWLKEIDSQLLQQALADCKKAFINFIEKRAGFPQFKRKHDARQSFRIPQRVKVDNGRVYIPKIGWIKIRQSQVTGPTKSATFKRNAVGEWHVTLVAEIHIAKQPLPEVKTETAIGIDVGFARFATDSNGVATENPRFFRKGERKIKRASRKLSRCKNGSANKAKARHALAKAHEKVSNQRRDFTDKFSTSIVEKNVTIACETLNLKGMSKTKLAKSVQDAAHGEVFRQLEYKAKWNNRRFVKIGQWFPSSKMCSCCGYRNQDLSLSERFWTCPDCGTHHDRDLNAATNIRDEGVRMLAVGHPES